jgi:PadR family transcriptional regulator, regulatory protein AphA
MDLLWPKVDLTSATASATPWLYHFDIYRFGIAMNIRTLCLGILSFQEASGYEIKKEIEDGMFSHFIDASYGSIYPALTLLNAEGLVSLRAEEQTGRPDKKVYAITDAGHIALSKALSVVPARDKYKSEFLFEMLMQHYLTPSHIIVALEKQLADQRQELDQMNECKSDPAQQKIPGCEFVMGYGHAVLTAGVSYIELKLTELKALARRAVE